ncbi:mCG147947 [Mus musculus]|nr:mCG147947 [Mus musculus]
MHYADWLALQCYLYEALRYYKTTFSATPCLKTRIISLMQWSILFTQALWRQRQISEFKDNVVYKASFKTAMTVRETLSEKLKSAVVIWNLKRSPPEASQEPHCNNGDTHKTFDPKFISSIRNAGVGDRAETEGMPN